MGRNPYISLIKDIKSHADNCLKCDGTGGVEERLDDDRWPTTVVCPRCEGTGKEPGKEPGNGPGRPNQP